MSLRHIQDQSVFYGTSPPDANRLGQLWMDNSTVPGTLNECIDLDPLTYQQITGGGGGGGGAPTNAEYLVGALNGGLSNERLVTDTITISWNLATPGEVTANLVNASVTNVKLATMPTVTIKGNNTGSTGAPLDLTASQVKTMLAIAASDVSGLANIATSGSADNLDTGTIPEGRMPAHDGDVTSPAGDLTLTIPNDTVTLAKMQNIATQRLMGRSTAGTGDIELITIGSNLTLAAGVLSASGGGGGGSANSYFPAGWG